MIVIDTNVVSELMRPEPERSVLGWMDGLRRAEIGITAITVAEILYGIGAMPESKRRQRLFQVARSLFDEDFGGRIYPFDHLAAVEYADIVLQRGGLGSPISMPDAQIAAICRASDHQLATRNVKDFQNTGVSLMNPWEM
jgi:hypothetical protein